MHLSKDYQYAAQMLGCAIHDLPASISDTITATRRNVQIVRSGRDLSLEVVAMICADKSAEVLSAAKEAQAAADEARKEKKEATKAAKKTRTAKRVAAIEKAGE
jgi:hypothetical protein